MSYGTKVYGTAYAGGTFVVAAVIFGLLHLWWVGGVLCVAAVIAFVVVGRIAHSGSDSERRELVDAGERAIGAAGQAESGGWTPRRTGRDGE